MATRTTSRACSGACGPAWFIRHPNLWLTAPRLSPAPYLCLTAGDSRSAGRRAAQAGSAAGAAPVNEVTTKTRVVRRRKQTSATPDPAPTQAAPAADSGSASVPAASDALEPAKPKRTRRRSVAVPLPDAESSSTTTGAQQDTKSAQGVGSTQLEHVEQPPAPAALLAESEAANGAWPPPAAQKKRRGRPPKVSQPPSPSTDTPQPKATSPAAVAQPDPVQAADSVADGPALAAAPKARRGRRKATPATPASELPESVAADQQPQDAHASEHMQSAIAQPEPQTAQTKPETQPADSPLTPSAAHTDAVADRPAAAPATAIAALAIQPHAAITEHSASPPAGPMLPQHTADTPHVSDPPPTHSTTPSPPPISPPANPAPASTFASSRQGQSQLSGAWGDEFEAALGFEFLPRDLLTQRVVHPPLPAPEPVPALATLATRAQQSQVAVTEAAAAVGKAAGRKADSTPAQQRPRLFAAQGQAGYEPAGAVGQGRARHIAQRAASGNDVGPVQGGNTGVGSLQGSSTGNGTPVLTPASAAAVAGASNALTGSRWLAALQDAQAGRDGALASLAQAVTTPAVSSPPTTQQARSAELPGLTSSRQGGGSAQPVTASAARPRRPAAGAGDHAVPQQWWQLPLDEALAAAPPGVLEQHKSASAFSPVIAGGARYNAQGSDVTTLFVKGLPSGAPEALLRAALLAAFETCGPIVQVRVPTTAMTASGVRETKGIAFVVFESPTGKARALQLPEPVLVLGRVLRLDSNPDRSQPATSGRTNHNTQQRGTGSHTGHRHESAAHVARSGVSSDEDAHHVLRFWPGGDADTDTDTALPAGYSLQEGHTAGRERDTRSLTQQRQQRGAPDSRTHSQRTDRRSSLQEAVRGPATRPGYDRNRGDSDRQGGIHRKSDDGSGVSSRDLHKRGVSDKSGSQQGQETAGAAQEPRRRGRFLGP